MKNQLYQRYVLALLSTFGIPALLEANPPPKSVQDNISLFNGWGKSSSRKANNVNASQSGDPRQKTLKQLAPYVEQVLCKYETKEQNILCAKINQAGQFEEKIKLIPVELKNPSKDFFQQMAEMAESLHQMVVYLDVNRSNTFKPYFFKYLAFRTSDGKVNICKANYFQDTNICNAMNGDYLGGSGPQQKTYYKSINLGEEKQERQNEHQNNNLGKEGQGWQNEHRIGFWKTLWKKQRVIFIIKYGNQTFIAVHTKQDNKEKTNITSDQWNTSLTKKVLVGAGAAAGIAAAAAAAAAY
jgi:hypothetical protein